VIEEPESKALAAYLKAAPHVLATSRIALVEVLRAVGIANPAALEETTRLLESCLLVDVSDALLHASARLASREFRTLDALHLASAQRVGADEVLAYDRRLADAAARVGFTVAQP
jgi:uncharacterized protein